MGWQPSLPFGFDNRIECLELGAGSARGKPNGTERDGHRRFHLRIRGDMGRTERSSARYSRRIRPYVRCFPAADRLRRAGRRAPADAEAAPVCAPVTADTRRQSAASDDRGNGADRHMAMASDPTRNAGLGLQNRTLQVRFLSHLPTSPEFMGIAAPCPECNVRALTPY